MKIRDVVQSTRSPIFTVSLFNSLPKCVLTCLEVSSVAEATKMTEANKIMSRIAEKTTFYINLINYCHYNFINSFKILFSPRKSKRVLSKMFVCVSGILFKNLRYLTEPFINSNERIKFLFVKINRVILFAKVP